MTVLVSEFIDRGIVVKRKGSVQNGQTIQSSSRDAARGNRLPTTLKSQQHYL